MSRIETRFAELRKTGRKALIPYITAGDPQPDLTVPLMHGLVAAGADIIELGVPFSDPMADGPVIQAAHERALSYRVSLRDVLSMVRRFREHDNDTPVALMGYLNPIEVMGYEAFADAAAEAGLDGVLTVDLPPEEGADLIAPLRARDIDPIFLIAPNTDESRIARISASASGFLYYVALKGVTGSANLDVAPLRERIETIRRHTKLPVGIGFGIRDRDSARQVASVADAVVVGSALVRRVAERADQPDTMVEHVCNYLRELRAGVSDASAS